MVSVIPNSLENKDSTLTPLDLINSIGEFDYVPCGFCFHKTAKVVNSWPSDGLKTSWQGRVWLNPSYSNPVPWLDKLIAHGEGVALVLASVETKWFQHQVFGGAHSILFLKGRPKFFRLVFSFRLFNC